MTSMEKSGAEGRIEQVFSHDTSQDKHQVDIEQAQQLAASYVPGSAEEKALIRKLDWRLVPTCWLLYLLSNVDRTNIGNAKIGGMEEDFDLTSNQYSMIVLVFFISYLICEVPSNMILNRVRPSLYLPLLGVLVAFAGALSGLLAGVITDYMDDVGGIRGWRWLFILEGLASVVVAIGVFFALPDFPTSTRSKFLTEEERILACNRLALEGVGLTQGAHERISEWKAFKMTCADWRTWCLCLLFSLGTASQTMQYFIPSLVKTFGWTGNTAQYYTIPAYAFALVCILVCCFTADRLKTIWPVLASLSGFGFVFFVATTAATDGMTRYALAIFAFGAIYGCSPLCKTWISHVLGYPAEKRAVAIALINAIGNGSSIYGSFLWPSRDSPRYLIGFGTTTAWMGMLSVGTVLFAFLFKKFPAKKLDHSAVMARQLQHEREEQQRKTMA
ncbi:MFS transporter prlL [Pseudocercospora fuligena]|uniref:MFS transporter prlL n=1 Tax=Pseudocercospora fuligena TaxID=685502 RepID=A0A8H6RBX1_9PEZI|nr:MFS transporter prlL [Pseudocercospora fuligena]